MKKVSKKVLAVYESFKRELAKEYADCGSSDRVDDSQFYLPSHHAHAQYGGEFALHHEGGICSPMDYDFADFGARLIQSALDRVNARRKPGNRLCYEPRSMSVTCFYFD